MTLERLATHYQRHCQYADDPMTIEQLDEMYRVRRHATVAGIAVVASATAIASHLQDTNSDSTIDPDRLDPQVREAFELAFPNQGVHKLARSTPEDLDGHLSAWSGKLFEIKVRDRLNSGEWVGELHLEGDQIAALAASPTQEAWDLVILPDGTPYQLKATESIHYVRDTVDDLRDEFPDLEYVVTDDAHIPGVTINSGISDDELDVAIDTEMAEALDATDRFDDLGDVLPYVGVVAVLAAFGFQIRRITASRDRGVPWSRIAKVESGSTVGRVASLLSPLPLTGRLTRRAVDWGVWSREARQVIASTTRRVERMVSTMTHSGYPMSPVPPLSCCVVRTPPSTGELGQTATPKPADSQVTERLGFWKSMRVLAFALWGVSVLALAASILLAFLLWSFSFGLWLTARTHIWILSRRIGAVDP